MTVPVSVIVPTRNEAVNIERCLQSVHGWADQVFVIDSESSDETVALSHKYAHVQQLPYDHSRIIPWIYQWGLENLPIRNEWVLILEADQKMMEELKEEINALFRFPESLSCDGFFIKRRQIFRGKEIRFGGYGNKYMLKLFKRGKGSLDPIEQDTRVYVPGPVLKLKGAIEEYNLKEISILFYLQKHLRYADAFAKEEWLRKTSKLSWKLKPSLWGTPDERILRLKGIYYQLPLFIRPFLYFFYRYFLLLGFLDGKEGFFFHFFQAFWFRLVIDIRMSEMKNEEERRADS